VLQISSASNRSGVNVSEQELDFDLCHSTGVCARRHVGGKRNVLKRFERVELLKKRGQWKEGDRITGLRKTKKDV